MLPGLIFIALCLSILHVKLVNAESQCMNVICYYDKQAYYRPVSVSPRHIIPLFCSHIHFFKAIVVNFKVTPERKEDNTSRGLYSQLMTRRSGNPDLKVILTVAGFERQFYTIAISFKARRIFVSSAIKYLRDYGFDGIDVNLQIKDGRHARHLALILMSLKDEFSKESIASKRPTLLLSASIDSNVRATLANDRKDLLTQHVDYLVIKTGVTSPLYPIFEGDRANVKWILQQWLEAGTNKLKLHIALDLSGIIHSVQHPSSRQSNPTVSREKHYMKKTGSLAYFQICELFHLYSNVSTVVQKYGIVYAFLPDKRWIIYDNQETIIRKSNYARQVGIGGVAIMFIDMDDVNGKSCGDGAYPLTRAVAPCHPHSNTIDHLYMFNKIIG